MQKVNSVPNNEFVMKLKGKTKQHHQMDEF